MYVSKRLCILSSTEGLFIFLSSGYHCLYLQKFFARGWKRSTVLATHWEKMVYLSFALQGRKS